MFVGDDYVVGVTFAPATNCVKNVGYCSGDEDGADGAVKADTSVPPTVE